MSKLPTPEKYAKLAESYEADQNNRLAREIDRLADIAIGKLSEHMNAGYDQPFNITAELRTANNHCSLPKSKAMAVAERLGLDLSLSGFEWTTQKNFIDEVRLYWRRRDNRGVWGRFFAWLQGWRS